MKGKPNNEQEKQIERERILDQATIIISQRGIAELSMRTLAKELKMSATNIYHYFHNRDEILLHIIYSIYTMVIKIRDDAYHVCSDPIEGAQNVLWAVFYFSVEKYPYYDVVFGRRTFPDLEQYKGTELEALAQKLEQLLLNKFDLWEEIVRTVRPGKSNDEYKIIVHEIGARFHGALRFYHTAPFNKMFTNTHRMVAYTINQIIIDLQDPTRWNNI